MKNKKYCPFCLRKLVKSKTEKILYCKNRKCPKREKLSRFRTVRYTEKEVNNNEN